MFGAVEEEFRRGSPIGAWRRVYRTRESVIAPLLVAAGERWPRVLVGSYPSFVRTGPEVEVGRPRESLAARRRGELRDIGRLGDLADRETKLRCGVVDLVDGQRGQPGEQNRSKITNARPVTITDRPPSPERDTPSRPPLLRQSRCFYSPRTGPVRADRLGS